MYRIVEGALAGVALVLAIVAQAPDEWLDDFGAWMATIQRSAIPGVLGVLLALNILLLYRNRKNPFPGGDGSFSEYASVVNGIRRRNNQGEEHQVRLVIATGGTTFSWLQQTFTIFRSQAGAKWHVKVLLMSPSSRWVDECAPHWKREASAGLMRLHELRRELDERGPNIVLEWATYDIPPKIRGLAFDDDELYIGYFVWDRGPARRQLGHQQSRYMHFIKGEPGFAYHWPFFQSWFDWEWDNGERGDSVVGGDALTEEGLREQRSTGTRRGHRSRWWLRVLYRALKPLR